MNNYHRKVNKMLYICISIALCITVFDAIAEEFYDTYEPEDQWVEISEPSSDGVVDVFNPVTGKLTQEAIEQVYDNQETTEIETYDIKEGKIKTYYNRD